MPAIRTTLGILAVSTLSVCLVACGSESAPAENSSNSGAASCTPLHENLETVEPGVLSVAAYITPPYTIQNGDEIAGIEGLIVQEIADMECLTLDVQAVAGPALPSTIQSGRADVAIAGIYRTEEREASFNLSIPMYRDGLALLSKDGVDSLEELSGRTLGVIQGYLWNEEFGAALGADNVMTYQSSASLLADLQNGRVDAAAFTNAEAAYRANEDPSLRAAAFAATPEVSASQQQNDVVLLLAQDATELTNALNEDIEALLTDGSIGEALATNGVDRSLAATGS